jgi:hypothetical protein
MVLLVGFVALAETLGLETILGALIAGAILRATGAALVAAGLLSVLVFPVVATSLLGREAVSVATASVSRDATSGTPG